MNSEDQYRLEFDSMKVEMPNLPEGNVYEQVDQGKFYPELAKKSIIDKQITSTPVSEAASTIVPKTDSKANSGGADTKTSSNQIEMSRDAIGPKLDEIKKTMEGMNMQVKRNDTKIKLMSAQQETYLNTATFRLREAVGDAFDKIESKLQKNLEVDLGKKIDIKMTEMNKTIEDKIERDVLFRIEQSVKENLDKGLTDRMESMIDQKIAVAMNQNAQEIIEKKIDEKIDDAMNEQSDRKFDEVLEKKGRWHDRSKSRDIT